MIISATGITDGLKKDELIKYAASLGCKTYYSPKNEGMVVETFETKADKLIKSKIKELEKN